MKITLEKNSIDILESRFQNLLKGSDTTKYKYTSENQKQTTIKSLKSFIKERISEKSLNKNTEIWEIIMEIKKLDFNNIEEIKKIYSNLYNLKKNFHSEYYKQIGREKLKQKSYTS
jgi:hypothetical protein